MKMRLIGVTARYTPDISVEKSKLTSFFDNLYTIYSQFPKPAASLFEVKGVG